MIYKSWSLAFIFVVIASAIHDGRQRAKEYSNQWLVYLEADEETATQTLAQIGFENLGEIPGFESHYLVQKLDHPLMSEEASELHTRNLEEQIQVVCKYWFFKSCHLNLDSFC